jgi:His/Glu/Gln/Arg/opine family amino acid ABC transporter permease subunit
VPLASLIPEWFKPVGEYIIREGLPETLRVAAISVTASVVIGVLLGTLLTLKFRPLQWLIRFYVELWRGLPILVTVLFIYWLPGYDIGPYHLQLSAYQSAAVALSLWGSAQVAEATRGAVQSIPKEQHEAAAALGFGWVGRHTYVIVPQALRRLLPPMVGLLVNIIQNTTIASVIGLNELLQAATRQFENTTSGIAGPAAPSYAPFLIFGFIMAVFFVISFPLTRLAAYLEKRLV